MLMYKHTWQQNITDIHCCGALVLADESCVFKCIIQCSQSSVRLPCCLLIVPCNHYNILHAQSGKLSDAKDEAESVHDTLAAIL